MIYVWSAYLSANALQEQSFWVFRLITTNDPIKNDLFDKR